MMYDIKETGWLTNIRATSCTEEKFRKPSVNSLRWWYYTPKTQRGQFVTRTNVESSVTFRLMDSEGQWIGEDGRVEAE